MLRVLCKAVCWVSSKCPSVSLNKKAFNALINRASIVHRTITYIKLAIAFFTRFNLAHAQVSLGRLHADAVYEFAAAATASGMIPTFMRSRHGQ